MSQQLNIFAMSFKTRIDKSIFEQSEEFAIDSQFKAAITTLNS